MQIHGRMRRSMSLSARSTVSRPGTSNDGAGEVRDFQLTILTVVEGYGLCRVSVWWGRSTSECA